MTRTPWSNHRLSEVAAKGSNALATGPFGSSIGSRFFRSSGVPVIRGGNLSTNPELRLKDENFVFLAPEKAKEFSRSIVRRGDIIFTSWGTINQVGLIDESAAFREYVISNKQMKVTPDPSVALPEYLYYQFSGPDKQREIVEGSIGTSVPGFNLTRLRSMTVPLPTIAEQKRIVHALTDVDTLILTLEKIISKKRAIKRGMTQELLTGRTRLPGYSVPWSETRLGDVASGGRGAGLSKSSITASGRNPCLLYGELFTTYSRVIESVKSFTDEESGVRSAGGEVLLPGSTTTTAEDLATAGALLQRGVFIGGDVNILRPNRHKIDSVWLAYYLTNQLKKQIAEAGQGITIVHLYVRSLLVMEIELPPLPEQIAIGSVLQEADADIAVLERRLDATRDIKQGMMQELLTGRTRLPVGEEMTV